jgi:hypothetical protein
MTEVYNKERRESILSWGLLSIDHLHALADAIPPEQLREALAKLPPDLSVEIDVAVFYDDQAGYADFDRESLQMLNDYTANLTVTMYYCEEDEQKNDSASPGREDSATDPSKDGDE